MAEQYAPPVGPPPPKVPEGWKAVWNDQYQEWFFVNIYTKKSQWDKPTEPIYPPGEHAPEGPPPSYKSGGDTVDPESASRLSSNNPYASAVTPGTDPSHAISEDEKLARKLQAEEEARVRQHSPGAGAASSYYNQPGTSQPQQQYGYNQPNQQYGQYPPQESHVQTDSKGKGKGGLLGKLLAKASQSKPHSQPYGVPSHGAYGHSMQQPYYGPQAHYGKKPGMGMGTAGAAALGVGGGLLGGALLADAIDDHEYSEGYEQGVQDSGDYGGGDYDGGDFGGGDFGGGDF